MGRWNTSTFYEFPGIFLLATTIADQVNFIYLQYASGGPDCHTNMQNIRFLLVEPKDKQKRKKKNQTEEQISVKEIPTKKKSK